MNVKFVRIEQNAIQPRYATDFAAGADLFNYKEDVVLPPRSVAKIFTGIRMEIPDGYAGFVFARSGLACKFGVAPANKVGVIDSDYRGEITVVLFNHSENSVTIKKGDRVAQLVIMPYAKCSFEESDELSETERGERGFGSSGK